MLIFVISYDYKKQCCHRYEVTLRQFSYTYQDVDLSNNVDVMMIRTKKKDISKLYSQTRLPKKYLNLQVFIKSNHHNDHVIR
jgi:hypothetical protein